MSGIAGLFYPGTPKPVDPGRVAHMCDAMAHRGPDGAGVWTGPGIGLGHRRLATIDASGGHQPMASEDGTLTVSFDGAIYNLHELRAALAEKGARFRTDSDAEVLLHGWRAWGPDLLPRLNGIFAIALHDAAHQSLFLARDRLGAKPLHHVELADGAVAFASELKGLLAHPLVRRSVDPAAIEDFMGLGYIPDDACIVAGARKLAAGHFLLIRRGHPVPSPRQWWDIDFSARTSGGVADLTEEQTGRLRAAVRSRMVADVPPGAFLSGDIDTAAVVALMAESSKQAVRTFAVGADAGDADERATARLIAARFATDHRDAAVGHKDLALIDTLVAAFDEPFGDPSALATYRRCELARGRVSVALSGVGADHALAGDPRHRDHVVEGRMRAVMPAPLRRAAGALGRIYPQADWIPRPMRARTRLLALAEDGPTAYARGVSVTRPELRARLYNDAMMRTLGDHAAELRYWRTMRAAPGRDALDAAQYADLRHALSAGLLTEIDRVGMAMGLEVREPLLDHQLIEFAATLPVSLRIRSGQGKWLMKRALEPWLPREVLYRSPPPPVAPLGAWFRGPLAEEGLALARAPMLANWFQPAAIETLARDHQAGRADHGRTLWQLLMLKRSTRRLFG